MPLHKAQKIITISTTNFEFASILGIKHKRKKLFKNSFTK